MTVKTSVFSTSAFPVMDFSILLRPECYIPFFLSAALWTLLYMLLLHVVIPKFVNPNFEHIRNSKKLQYRIANFITSFLNSIVLSYVSLFWLHDILDLEATEENCNYESTSMQRVWIMMANGFWAYDTVVFAIWGEKKYSGKVDIKYMFHHILGILLLGGSSISKGANIAINVLWFHEWNSFLITGAVLIDYFLPNNTKEISKGLWIVFILKVLYLISFIALRFGIGIPFGVQLMTHHCPLIHQIATPSLWFLNAIMILGLWLFLDLRNTYSVLKKSGRNEEAQMAEIAVSDGRQCAPSVPAVTKDSSNLNIYVSWKNLKFAVPDPKDKNENRVILNDLNGHVKWIKCVSTDCLQLHSVYIFMLCCPIWNLLDGRFVKPGELVAVIGPSGSGKSSFLNCIAGRNVDGVTGDILFNDSQRPPNFARFTGYVLQSDLCFETLTVMETLEFTAALKLPTSLSRADRMKRINEVIEELDLEKCRNTIIGSIGNGISGGERRRLAIGVEILDEPSLLLLDEPTSGLDSASALMVGKILKRLAETRNITILCTVHQPRFSLASMFDKLYVLGKGHELYFGPSFPNPVCLQFFEKAGFKCPEHENPADFLLDLINTHGDETTANQMKMQLSEIITAKDDHPTANSLASSSIHLSECSSVKAGKPTLGALEALAIGDIEREHSVRSSVIMELSKTYQDSELRKCAMECQVPEDQRGDKIFSKGPNAFYVTPWYHQMWVITKRTFLDKWRDPTVTISHVAYCFTAPVLPGLVFWQIDLSMPSIFDRISAIAMMGGFMCFFRFDIIELFPAERTIFNREHISGMYRPISFFVGRNVAELPLQFIFVWIMGTIAYWMYGLQNDAEKYMIYMLIMESLAVSASGFLFMFSTFGKNRDTASVTATLGMIVSALFDGNWVSLEKVPVYCQWVPYIDYLSYASQAAIANEYRGITFIGGSGDGAVGICTDESGEIRGEDVLSLRGMDDVNIYHNIMMLWVLAIGYRVVAFFGFWLLYRPISKRQIIKNTLWF